MKRVKKAKAKASPAKAKKSLQRFARGGSVRELFAGLPLADPRRFVSDGALGEADATVSVRYIQTSADGHAFDLRIADCFEPTT